MRATARSPSRPVASPVSVPHHHPGLAVLADDEGRRGCTAPRIGLRRLPARSAADGSTGALEIQAYDELCFPGLHPNGRLNAVAGALCRRLTMELPTEADDAVASWIAAGTPDLLRFRQHAGGSLADRVAMIGAACGSWASGADLLGAWRLQSAPQFDHVKVVRAVTTRRSSPPAARRPPRRRRHHGRGLRAGVPTLILWVTRSADLGAQSNS